MDEIENKSSDIIIKIVQKTSKELKEKFKEKAQKFEEDKENENAEDTYLEWINTSPNCTDAKYEYVSFLVRKQDYTKAKAVVGEAIKIAPNEIKFRKQLASIFECEGSFEKALEVYDFTYEVLSAHASNKELGSLLCDRAICFRALGQTDKAICDLSDSLKLFPSGSKTFAEAHWDLAMMLRKQGKLLDAQKHFDLALKFNDNLSKWHGKTYIDFLMNPIFCNEYDEACQVAKFPCHNLCSAVSVDLMILNWVKLTDGLRNFVRQACGTLLRNVVQKRHILLESYEDALAKTELERFCLEEVIAFLVGEHSTFYEEVD